jgi:hypothetical protein
LVRYLYHGDGTAASLQPVNVLLFVFLRLLNQRNDLLNATSFVQEGMLQKDNRRKKEEKKKREK